MDLFAGIPVRDFASSLQWYEQLLGVPPSFFPHPTEAVWEVAEHRFVYVVEQPENAGHARVLLFVEDLDTRLSGVRARGLEPVADEAPEKNVRKVTFRDADGNELAFGGQVT